MTTAKKIRTAVKKFDKGLITLNEMRAEFANHLSSLSTRQQKKMRLGDRFGVGEKGKVQPLPAWRFITPMKEFKRWWKCYKGPDKLSKKPDEKTV